MPVEASTEEPTPRPTATPVPTPVQVYISMAGRKIWDDHDNASGIRPDAVTVRLVRNGTVIEERTVSAANDWHYSFDNLPFYDQKGKPFVYTLSEQPVGGYYALVDGNNLVNKLLDEPAPPQGPTIERMSEEELTSLIYLPNYKTPLYGALLKTGLELPAYPFVFAGIGCVALIVLLAAGRKKRKDDA